MKTRAHHNNKGRRQIKSGNCERGLRLMALRLGLSYKIGTKRIHSGAKWHSMNKPHQNARFMNSKSRLYFDEN